MSQRTNSSRRLVGPEEAEAMLSTMFAERLAAAFGGTGPRITEGEGLAYHDEPKIYVPRSMSYDDAISAIKRAQKEAETETEWDRVFRYRFNDGAYAAMQVMKRRYGGSTGESIQTFFGEIKPELRTINIAYGETAQVPHGKLSLPALPGVTVFVLATRDPEYGVVTRINVEGPRKFKGEVAEFFNEIEEYLKTNSIYRGKALVGANELEFINLSNINPYEIVFSTDAEDLLETAVWSVLANAPLLRREGIPVKRAALLYGPYGTGKTSAAMITALKAVNAGFTVVHGRSGRDDIGDVLRTARLYQPAVVVLEDVDAELSSANDSDVSAFLEAFDGVTSKGSEVIAVMTTNHLERVHKGMLRPGRIDAVIPIDSLDAAGIKRLIKAVVPADRRLSDDGMDWDEITESMRSFYPAFVREAVDRARVVAITNSGTTNYALDTAALVAAARTLRAQLDALERATTGEKPPALETALTNTVRQSMVGLVARGDCGEDWLITSQEPVGRLAEIAAGDE